MKKNSAGQTNRSKMSAPSGKEPMKSGIEPTSDAAFKADVGSSLASTQSQQANEMSFGEVVSLVNRHSKLLVLADVRSGASFIRRSGLQTRASYRRTGIGILGADAEHNNHPVRSNLLSV